MEITIVKSFSKRIDAEIAKGVLGAVGINSFIKADDGGGWAPYLLNATGFVKLVVDKKDFKKACQVLKINE